MLGAREAAGLEPHTQGEHISSVRAKLALAHMTQNFCNPELRVTDIANAQRVSTRYLHQLLEQEGIHFKAFITDKRLDKAYRDLTDPALHDWTVSDIALACGFSDVSHFNRVFRTRYDATPSSVRSRRQNGS